MIKILLLTLSLLLFTSCSFKTPKNDWQRKSTNAFNSYTKNFLQNNEALAKNDLSRAEKHAKQSADLTQLAKIYIGSCALNISVGTPDTCKQYKNISDVVSSASLDAYYSLLHNSLKKEQIKFLPSQYHAFVEALRHENYKVVNKEIQTIKKDSSLFLCASLVKDEVSIKTIKKVIEIASNNGYKKVVLFWLEGLKKVVEDEKEKESIDKKISILNSNI